MNWRDILLGAIVTLIVTVIGSAITYYLTREPPPASPTEELIYEIDTPVSFDSGQTKMSFFNLRVKNIGQKPATNVTVGVEFDDKVRIIDQSISLSSGPVGNIDTQSIENNQLKTTLSALTPDEIAKITILTDTAEGKYPIVGVKSNASIGEPASLSAAVEVSSKGLKRVEILIIVAILVQVVVLLLMRQRFSQAIGRIMPVTRGINNTGFVLLHSGLIDEALDLLSKGIRDAGTEPIILANYGLAVGLNGDLDQSRSVLRAADFWANKKSHAQAVIAFNRSLLAFECGDDTEGLEELKKAFQMSKREISRYMAYSVIVSRLSKGSEGLRMFIAEHDLLQENR